MSVRLYVGNLPFSVDDEKLRVIFNGNGRTVTDSKVVTDRETGRSRGFGFVEFSSEAEGQSAIKDLNETDCDGRKLVVNEARPKTQGGDRGGDRGDRGSRPPRNRSY